jgi:hypothetical protein
MSFFIERAPQYRLFEFDHLKHTREGGGWDREVWTLGWHIVVSRAA